MKKKIPIWGQVTGSIPEEYRWNFALRKQANNEQEQLAKSLWLNVSFTGFFQFCYSTRNCWTQTEVEVKAILS